MKESFNSSANEQTRNQNSNNVSFFSLKDDGDEAVVRFMQESTDDFEIITTHPVTIGGKYRSVSCLRGAHDPLDKCPLCEAEFKLNKRFFIKITKYENVNGSVNAVPCVWERPMSYAFKLKDYLDNYGPLSDIICRIVRHGKAKSLDTNYEIIPNLSKQVFRDDLYVKDYGPYESYNALGTVVLNKTAEDMRVYLSTGSFPASNPQSNGQGNYSSYNNAPVQNNQYQQPTTPVYNDNGFTPTSSAEPKKMPWETGNATPVDRPTRYY